MRFYAIFSILPTIYPKKNVRIYAQRISSNWSQPASLSLLNQYLFYAHTPAA